ncbi:Rmf/CrpP fold protein [Streptomyces sp. NPDC059720]|uniref:Rmf/CrpP fold protein n=1 Tax=Streptomyces sp. NPDC059720 TaxID=3346924 RepID=UPI00367560CF
MGARGDIIRAVVAGRQAGREGALLAACPYPATSLLRTAWINGYAQVRTLPPVPPAPNAEGDGEA